MLSMNKYPKPYIEACRARAAAQVASYRKLAKTAKGDAALAAFEPVFYNNMVLILDAYFVHRARTLEGKDGNPLNEVRVICNSILQNNGLMGAEKSIKMNPAQSVLKHRVGDEIRVTEGDYAALAKAFFAEIEKKFS